MFVSFDQSILTALGLNTEIVNVLNGLLVLTDFGEQRRGVFLITDGRFQSCKIQICTWIFFSSNKMFSSYFVVTLYKKYKALNFIVVLSLTCISTELLF